MNRYLKLHERTETRTPGNRFPSSFDLECWVLTFQQATSTVEVDMERAEKLQVTRADFKGSLNNDIKPVRSGHVGTRVQGRSP